jgi:DNA-binding transcriptional LysR family regulator
MSSKRRFSTRSSPPDPRWFHDWDLVNGRSKVRVPVSGSMESHDCLSVSDLGFRGQGVGLLPSTYCDTALAEGRLVRLLPRWLSRPIPVSALCPSRKFLPPRGLASESGDGVHRVSEAVTARF